jgi:phage virion morphogenesis protein
MLAVQFNAGASRKAIADAIRQLEDMTPVFTDIGEYMVEATRQRFAKGTAPDGTAWAPKREATLERYRRLGYGSLARPLIGPARALSRQIQRVVSRDGVVIGSSLIYSGVQQQGAAKGAFGTDSRGRPVPWGNIPARVWLGIARDDEKAILDIVDEHLESKLES